MRVSKTTKPESNETNNKLIGSLINNSSDVLIIDDLNLSFDEMFSKNVSEHLNGFTKKRRRNKNYQLISFHHNKEVQ